MKRRTIVSLAVLAGMVATAVAAASTSVKPYVVPIGSEYEVDALFSAGDTVPVLGGSGTYRMVGIPDGLGAHANPNGTSTLFMNHELGFTAQSEPYVGGAKNRGAFVSKWILDADGDPTAGKRAYDKVYIGDTLVGDAATTANSTPAFTRFCSGSPPDRQVLPGIWETSGIIDTASIFGPDTWLSDVQAHSPTPAPGGSTVTVEDGQLFLLRPTT